MSRRAAGEAVKARRLRCAIYTRKSSDEGLEQGFNSLHAQREACEAYVLSQAGEGWKALTVEYDDGGFSGGSMERPGLRRLLADIDRGLIDIVVVYKVDRLTRSLADFARIVDQFDAKGVSFVSVTQAFNTTSSMGRLTLNVLLSFAQFEREVTGERIRDKIAASKAKGMWMGGNLPLGYDAPPPGGPRALVINAAEAETVRDIFRRYLELGTVHGLRDELEQTGVRSKLWTSASGKQVGGKIFSRGALFHLLKNPTYIGLIPHKERTQPGLHAAIIDADLFEAVQVRLADNARDRGAGATGKSNSPLKGLLHDGSGQVMSPTIAYGKNKRSYRYYVSSPLQRGEKLAGPEALVRRVPAGPLEDLVIDRMSRLLGRRDPAPWSQIHEHLVRADLSAGAIELVCEGLAERPSDVDRFGARLQSRDRLTLEPDGERLRLKAPMRQILRGGRSWLVGPTGVGAVQRSRPDPALIKALKSAHAKLLLLDASPMTARDDLHEARSPADSYVRRLMPLAFLAPDIQRAIMEGRHPPGLTLQHLLDEELPLDWAEQRRAILR